MKTESAKAAAAIRKELKANFPNIKFRVRSQNYSMGDNVNVEYVDGPAVKDVEAITDKYEYGSFNGMEDIYEITNNRDHIPQTKYLVVERSMSDASRSMIESYVERTIHFDSNYEWENGQIRNREMRRIFDETAYPEHIHQTA